MPQTLRVLTLTLLVLAALVPAVNVFPWLFPAPWGQGALVRILAPLLGVLVLLRAAYEPGFFQEGVSRLKAAKPVLLTAGLFLAVYALSLLFSADRSFSFWGDPTRGWGALNYLLSILVAFAAFLSLSKREWKTLWLAFVAGAFFVALVAFAQRLALAPGLIDPSTRPHGTLGNPLLLGAYLVPLAFLLLGFFSLQASAKKRWGLLLAALFLFAGALLPVNRSTLLGLGAGLLFFLFFSPLNTRVARLAGLGAAALGTALLVFLFLNPVPPPFLGEQLASAWSRFTPQGIAQTERLAGWQIELKGIAERPLLGYGPYNSWVGFNKHFTQEFAQTHNSTGWWDTAHNLYLDIAADTGLLGLGSFLAFLGVLFWELARVRRRAAAGELFTIHALQAALLFYLVSMLPSFNSPATYLLFFMLVAYALRHIAANSQSPIANSQSFAAKLHPNLQLAAFGLLGILTLFFLYTAALKPAAVNKEINLAVREAETGNCGDALERMARSFPEGSHFADYHRLMEVEIIGTCLSQPSQNAALLSGRAVELERVRIQEHPLRPRPRILLAGYLNNLMRFSQDEQERELLAQEAAATLQGVQELNPQRPAVYAVWMETERLRGNLERARELARQCLALAPLDACAWQEFLNRVAQGEYSPSLQEALQETREYKGIGYQTEGFYVRLAQAYAKHQERHYPQLRELYERLVGLRPNNLQYRAALATVYRELGEREKALQQLQEMWRLQPTQEMQEQINAFLRTLP